MPGYPKSRLKERESYVDGRNAFTQLKKPSDNPHDKGFNIDRRAWFEGYYDARTKFKLWPLLERCEVEWP